MAVTPTFISDMATLKSRMRLSGASQSDALAMIDTAVQQVRILIFSTLGIVRVNQILAKGYNENAMSNDEIIRLRANNLEVNATRMYLLRTMPTLFMDSSGAKREAWNDEGFTRRAQQKELQDEIDRLWLDIQEAFAGLLSDDPSLAATNTQGGVINVDPSCWPSPIRIGRSLQGGYNHLQDQFNVNIGYGYFQGGCL